MSNETVGSQVKAGFRRAGAWLLGFAWFGLVLAGIAIAFTASPHSPIVGWLLLAIAAAVCIATMDRWIIVFSGLLAYGVIGGISMILTGHSVNHPEVLVPRWYAVIVTLQLAGSALVSFSFTNRKLRIPDRVALVVFVVCFFLDTWKPGVQYRQLVAVSFGFACLVAAWAYDRWRRRVRHERRSAHTSL